MGNVSSNSHGKVFLWDGSVKKFSQPLTVAEMMLEHPRHVVVEIHSAVDGKRPTPLPADMKLDLNKVYLMVPLRGGKPATLSSEELRRRVVLCANSALRSSFLLSSSAKFLPWFAKICPAVTVAGGGMFPVDAKKENIGIGKEDTWEMEVSPESLELRPEYLSRQLSGKNWKPSLDTIKEKKIEKKLSYWLFN